MVDIRSIKRCPNCAGKDEVQVVPRRSGSESKRGDTCSLAPKCSDCGTDQRNSPTTARRLRFRYSPWVAPQVLQRVLHADSLRVQIRVAPAERKGLTKTESSGEHECVQVLVTVSTGAAR